MKEDNNIIYLDEEGYNAYLQDIENTRKELGKISKMRLENHLHDADDAKREEYKIIGELTEKLQKLQKIQVIKTNDIKDLICINDFVTVDMMFSEDDVEECMFKLVASNTPDTNASIPEITINSPLGKAVYLQEVGYLGNYSVEGNEISFLIKDFRKNLDIEEVKKINK